jgi:RHS repeat-associated protein
MQLGSEAHIPDGLLAANALLAENSRQGFGTYTHTLHQGLYFAISSTAIGISSTLYDSRIGSRCTGKYHDDESGLDYFGARYNSSNMGRFMSPDWTAEADPVPYAELDNPQTLNLYSYVQNNPLSRTDPFGHASDPCNGDPNCVTVTADGPAMIPLLEAGGHHFVDQSLIRAKDAWNSLSGQFFRRWSTGKLPNPGLHKGFSTPHRLNSAQIRNIIDKVEKEVGKPMSKWDASDIEKAVEEVKSADGDTGAFLSHIAENNPAARTVTADIQDVMSAAKGAMNSIRANAGAIEEDVKDAVAACEEGGCPPP